MPPASGPRASTGRIALALFVIYLVWGSTYLAIRIAIDSLPPLLMAATRFLSAGILLFLWERARGTPWPSAAHWRSAAVVGGLLLLGGNGLVCWAQQWVPSGLAALVIAMVPLWMVLFETVATRAWPSGRVLAGLGIGFTGLSLLVAPRLGVTGDARQGPAVAALLGATLSWSLGSYRARSAPRPASGLMAAAMQMICGGTLLVGMGLLLGEGPRVRLDTISRASILALAYLSLIGSILAYSCYMWLLEVSSAALATTYAFVNPVVAVLLGYAILGEPLTARTLVAAAVIVAGVALITLGRKVK